MKRFLEFAALFAVLLSVMTLLYCYGSFNVVRPCCLDSCGCNPKCTCENCKCRADKNCGSNCKCQKEDCGCDPACGCGTECKCIYGKKCTEKCRCQVRQ
jgi:hypothetical protein